MDDISLKSVKYWAMLCCYVCFAFVLTLIPIRENIKFLYVDVIILLVSIVSLAKFNIELWVKMLLVSALVSSVFAILFELFPLSKEIVNNKMYYIIMYALAMSPLIYECVKEKNWCSRSGVMLIGVGLISFLLYLFTSPVIINITAILCPAIFIGFFVSSAIDTSERNTRYISYLAGIGALIILLNGLGNILWELCEKPEYYYWFSDNSELEKYQTYHFLIGYYSFFKLISIIGCIFIMTYFLYILIGSNYALKTISIPAIIACVLMLVLTYISPFYNCVPVAVIIYILFFISFYKLQNKI